MCPPATKSCPSGRNAKPEQKMFAPACVAGVFVLVDGFQRVGLSPRLNDGQPVICWHRLIVFVRWVSSPFFKKIDNYNSRLEPSLDWVASRMWYRCLR